MLYPLSLMMDRELVQIVTQIGSCILLFKELPDATAEKDLRKFWQYQCPENP